MLRRLLRSRRKPPRPVRDEGEQARLVYLRTLHEMQALLEQRPKRAA